ncbi:precorrin-6y C5,15-methyltransferase (decarboxylating) subunit CbiE [Actinoplanes nipponensis]|uniref:precorrin-6y C5,15-methyltransferase (decarboxylating) subunit CbiE n=1 Tax=Actinoplanes nipponensis TaxID=135950 RepID=UPI00194363C6|nr:precorrin-6y C5,15-methyltransferase (decarboxylating) subunit CbiE [Actinoplanes nipponensis]
MTDEPAGLTVVGIGADGWPGLSGTATAALAGAQVIFGSSRQLALLPPSIAGDRVPWPSPLVPALPGLLDAHRGRRIAVLASGDPMFHGIGATLVRLLGAAAVRVVPHPSSVSLAAARLGWPLSETDVLSLVTAPVEELHPLIHPGRRILLLSAGAQTPAAVAALLTSRGYGNSTVTVLEQLGASAERVISGLASSLELSDIDPLNVVAVACPPSPVRQPTGPLAAGPARVPAEAGRDRIPDATGPRPLVPGLPDAVYESDGQLTKREVRAVTLAVLGPQPGELLWDVGAGSGSIAIEWMRTHRDCRAVAIESDPVRAGRIVRNAAALGVPKLRVVEGRAPGALAGLPAPDVVFIGGGVTRDGVVEAALDALPGGGRLVANAVTLESEAVLAAWYAKLGGDLTRVAVQRAAPVGGFTGWRAMMPVTIWSVTKP